MDLTKDEGMRKSVIDQMLGELDDVTADSLRKPKGGPVKGVEIAITVSPKSEEDLAEDMPEGEECDVEGCEDPAHKHGMAEGEEEPESGNYISQLLKKLG